jgi:hypothetical protein
MDFNSIIISLMIVNYKTYGDKIIIITIYLHSWILPYHKDFLIEFDC